MTTLNIEVQNQLKAASFSPPTYQWFAEVIDGLVTNVSCNGGSSNSSSAASVSIGSPWSWNASGQIPATQHYSVDVTVGAAFQQSHSLNNIAVAGPGLTLSLVYFVPNAATPVVAYGYVLGSQEPVMIGIAVQGVSS